MHQDIRKLEWQLVRQIANAKEKTAKVIVVYGGRFCYVNPDDPTRCMQTIIEEQGPGVVKVEASHCIDMIADETERAEIAMKLAGGDPVWWMTPGWVKFRKEVYKGWGKALANENFPRHTGGAIILDSIGYMESYIEEHPEEFLEYYDWMGIPLMHYPVTLDRFRSLLVDAAGKF